LFIVGGLCGGGSAAGQRSVTGDKHLNGNSEIQDATEGYSQGTTTSSEQPPWESVRQGKRSDLQETQVRLFLSLLGVGVGREAISGYIFEKKGGGREREQID
jgi:hypothetical protein